MIRNGYNGYIFRRITQKENLSLTDQLGKHKTTAEERVKALTASDFLLSSIFHTIGPFQFQLMKFFKHLSIKNNKPHTKIILKHTKNAYFQLQKKATDGINKWIDQFVQEKTLLITKFLLHMKKDKKLITVTIQLYIS